MIKAVFIDVDNTLLDFNECSKYAMKFAFKKYEIHFEERMFLTFHRINDNLWDKIEKGELTKSELHRIRWNLIFSELGIDKNGEEFEKIFFSKLSESAVPVSGAESLLKYLSKKYLVCIASNAAYDQQIKRLTSVGMYQYIDKMFISEQIGYPKPSKEFFQKSLKQISPISADEVMMIGDSLTADIQGGKNCGLKTCWYNHNHTEPSKKIIPDFTVNSLDEIKNIL